MCLVTQLYLILSVTARTEALQAPLRGFPGKNTGVGTNSLLQRIFLTQGLNPGLQRCRQILHHLSHILKINYMQ